MTLLTTLTPWHWALALAVPVAITALYFLRLKRTPLVVPSTLLWRKSVEDLRVNSLCQRLRRNLLLLLQLLIAAGLIAALLRPTTQATTSSRSSIIVIDNSASMATQDGQPTRLDAAKQIAIEQVVDQMRTGDEAMVVAFSDVASVKAGWTRDPQVLRHAVSSIEQTHRGTNLDSALRVLESAVDAGAEDSPSERARASVTLISDGAFAAIEKAFDAPVKFVSVGQTAENLGIVFLSVAPRASDPLQQQLFGRLQNFGDADVEVVVELWSNDQRIDLRRVSVPAKKSAGVVFALADNVGERAQLRLQSKDLFAVDDVAYAVVTTPRRAKVLRIGPSNAILDAVLSTGTVQALMDVESKPTSTVDESVPADVDLVIYDRCAPAALPASNTWFLSALPKGAQIEWKEVDNPVLLDWNSSHPAMRFLRLDDVRFFHAKAVEIDRQSATDEATAARPKAILETDRGVILFSLSRGVFTDLIFGSSLIADSGTWETDWPLKASFPLFVMNIARTLGDPNEETQLVARTDGSLSLRSASQAMSASLILPNGERRLVRAKAPGRFEYGDLPLTGSYEWIVGDDRYWGAVNLFQEAESRIAPAQSVVLGSKVAQSAQTARPSFVEWWKLAAVGALVLLVLEWLLYNRRVAVV